ncbi:MAG: hypothetical protein PHR61_02070 [Candidatus Absconditabacteria bacterium]|nr:hypothetical protein [Candidatus Absconditabacteria bacterium]
MSLKAYALDVDANLLHTDSKILLEKKDELGIWKLTEVSQSEFDTFVKDKENYRFVNGNSEESLINFRGKGKFQKDIFDAIENGRFGPSWDAFIKANLEASPISIITARGHPIIDIKNTHKAILHEVLSEYQLDELIDNMRNHLGGDMFQKKEKMINLFLKNNYYCPCSDIPFLKKINKNPNDPMYEKKTKSFENFVQHVISVFNNYYGKQFMNKRHISVGFSDDSKSNINGMEIFIKKELIKKYPNITYFLYDTGDPHKVKKTSFKTCQNKPK